jgi:hypothetical protein
MTIRELIRQLEQLERLIQSKTKYEPHVFVKMDDDTSFAVTSIVPDENYDVLIRTDYD